MTDIAADIDRIERACDLLYIYQLYSLHDVKIKWGFNSLIAKLFNWNFQVGENHFDLTQWRSTILKFADRCHV